MRLSKLIGAAFFAGLLVLALGQAAMAGENCGNWGTVTAEEMSTPNTSIADGATGTTTVQPGG